MQVRAIYQRILGASVATVLEAGQVLTTAHAVLEAAVAGAGAGVVARSVVALRTLAAVARKSSAEPLPHSAFVATAAGRAPGMSQEELADLCNFSGVWAAVLGPLSGLLEAVLGVWAPACRLRVQGGEMATTKAALYHMTRNEAAVLNVHYKLDVECLRESVWQPPDAAASAVYELRTALWEVLRTAMHHKAVCVHPAHASLVAVVVSALPHLEHHASRGFSEALSLFVEDYLCLHLPLPGALPGTVALASAVLTNCLARLHAGWGGVAPSASAVDPSASTSASASAQYRSCGLDAHPALQTLCGSADELAALRQASLWNLTRSVADLVASLMLTRGPLCQEPKSKGKGKGQRMSVAVTEEFQHHRRCLLALVLGSEAVRGGVMRLLAPLLETADATVCRRATLATEALFVQAVAAGRTDAVQVVASDAFSACLRVVVVDAPWSAGLEWSLLSLMELVYSRTVLGISGDESVTPPRDNKPSAKSSMTSWSGPGTASATTAATTAAVATPLGGWSRDVLLEVPGVTSEMVKDMEGHFLAVNRKKRKDYIRDVVVAAKVASGGDGVLGGVKAGAGGNRGGGGGGGGVLDFAAPVGGGYASARQQRRQREAASGVAQGGGEEALSGLFSS